MSASTIFFVIGLLLMVIGGSIVISKVLRRRSASDEVLKASISISQSSPAVVHWEPYDNLTEWRIMKLATLYVAKIGFVLDSGHPEIRDMFRTALEHLVGDDGSVPDDEFHARLEELAEGLQSLSPEPATTKTEEIFVITMVEQFSEDSISNTLPFRGLAANVPISAILLMNDVATRITAPMNLHVFERCVAHLVREMYQIDKFDLTSLRRLFMSIKLSYEGLQYEIEK